jgi:hypothetical protein
MVAALAPLTGLAALNVSGAMTNNGSISVERRKGPRAADRSGEFLGVGGDRQSSIRLERLVRADHQTKPARTRSCSSRQSLSPPRSQVSEPATRPTRRTFSRRERRSISSRLRGHRRHAHAARRESDRQHPDDRRLLEVEFHARPRQRDRHAGEVCPSRRQRRGTLLAWRGNQGKEEKVVSTSYRQAASP